MLGNKMCHLTYSSDFEYIGKWRNWNRPGWCRAAPHYCWSALTIQAIPFRSNRIRCTINTWPIDRSPLRRQNLPPIRQSNAECTHQTFHLPSIFSIVCDALRCSIQIDNRFAWIVLFAFALAEVRQSVRPMCKSSRHYVANWSVAMTVRPQYHNLMDSIYANRRWTARRPAHSALRSDAIDSETMCWCTADRTMHLSANSLPVCWV